jgi:uroporphyrinogen decarboxylase
MKAREVIDTIIRGGHIERIGWYDSPWSDTLQLWHSQGNIAAGEVNPFQFDMCNVGGSFDIQPIPRVSELVAETEEWAIRRNGAGAALKYWKNKSGTPEHIDFRMTSRDIWERDYREQLLVIDRSRVDVVDTARKLAAARQRGEWTFYGNICIWETMRQSLGDICMMESLLLDPEWILDYNRVYTDFFINHFRLLIEEAGKPDGIWIYEDLGYKNGLFCSPSTLADLFFPFYREIVEFFHGYNLPVVLHSCGGITEALPLIIASGFDALNPMEVKAGCDVLAFADRYADKIAFIGGLDARVLESGDRNVIKREVVRLVKGMKERGGRYVFGSDHSISPNVAYEDFLYAREVYREHMVM